MELRRTSNQDPFVQARISGCVDVACAWKNLIGGRERML
jgi:hypothetical protein